MNSLSLAVSSSSSSSSSTLHSGKSSSETSQSDCSPPHSPVDGEQASLSKLAIVPSAATNSSPQQAAEQALNTDPERTPQVPTPRSGYSPLMRQGLRSDLDDVGYECDDESSFSKNDPGSPRSRLLQADSVRRRSEARRSRRTSAPITVSGAALTSTPLSPTENLTRSPTKQIKLHAMKIDLGVLPAFVYQRKVLKVPVGLGLGLPLNHPLSTHRAFTTPETSGRMVPPPTVLLPSRPQFRQRCSRANEECQKPRLHPTILLNSPSPIDQLPPRFSRCTSPLDRPHLPLSAPLQQRPAPRKELKPTVLATLPSPMESLPSPLSHLVLFPAVRSPRLADAVGNACLLMADQANLPGQASPSLPSFLRSLSPAMDQGSIQIGLSRLPSNPYFHFQSE